MKNKHYKKTRSKLIKTLKLRITIQGKTVLRTLGVKLRTFRVIGVQTGRISCKYPNIQNVEKAFNDLGISGLEVSKSLLKLKEAFLRMKPLINFEGSDVWDAAKPRLSGIKGRAVILGTYSDKSWFKDLWMDEAILNSTGNPATIRGIYGPSPLLPAIKTLLDMDEAKELANKTLFKYPEIKRYVDLTRNSLDK